MVYAMSVDTWINLSTSIGTFLAVIVALGVSIVPALANKRQKRLISERRITFSLKLIKKAIKDYRYFNPTKYLPGDGMVLYAYDPKALPLIITFDLEKEIDVILLLLEYLRPKHQQMVWPTVEVLKKISTGFLYEETEWDRLEEMIQGSIDILPER